MPCRSVVSRRRSVRAGSRLVARGLRRLARGAQVVYLNGGVCGRVLPALRRPARVVLHIHDMVRRVPRFWRRADVVLAASHAVADRLHGLDAHVVYPPADPDPPVVASPWPIGNGPVVGFVGRLEPRKGPLDLVRAAPAIRRERRGDPDRDDRRRAVRRRLRSTRARCCARRRSSTIPGATTPPA